MLLLKRLLAVVVILVSLAFLVACVGSGVYLWQVRPEVEGKLDGVFGQAEGALGVLSGGIDRFQTRLAEGGRQLADVQELVAPLDGPLVESPLMQLILQKSRQKFEPELIRLREELLAVRDTAAALNGVIGAVEGAAAADLPELDAERLRELSGYVAKLADATGELHDVLADDNFLKTQESVNRLKQGVDTIDAVLQAAGRTVAAIEGKVAELQGQARVLQTRVRNWIQVGSVVATVVLAWFALSQVSLLAHGWRWLRSRGSGNAAG